MSYAGASALQTAVFAAISADLAVQAQVGANVFDAVPSGSLPLTYVVVGEEDVKGRSDQSAQGAVHDLKVSVFSAAAGYLTAKATAVAISDVLVNANLSLARGRLVTLDFLKAKARRARSPETRQIDLIFRARIDEV